MYVSTMDVDDAVLCLFAELHIPAGGRLAYASLVKEWPRRHLRHADLAESVQRLVRLRHLTAEQSADGSHHVILTDLGFERAAKIAALRIPSWTWRLRMWLTQALRSTTSGYSEPGRRRRLRDRVAPQLDLTGLPAITARAGGGRRAASPGGR